MRRHPNPRAIRAARTYTIPEAAEALGVSVGTVRGWVRQGLSAMTDKRPFLILGDHLRGFLEVKRIRRQARLARDQLYCLSCKRPESPMGLMVDCIPQTPKTARLVGLCGTCGGICNRMVSRARLTEVREIFDVRLHERRKA